MYLANWQLHLKKLRWITNSGVADYCPCALHITDGLLLVALASEIIILLRTDFWRIDLVILINVREYFELFNKLKKIQIYFTKCDFLNFKFKIIEIWKIKNLMLLYRRFGLLWVVGLEGLFFLRTPVGFGRAFVWTLAFLANDYYSYLRLN